MNLRTRCVFQGSHLTHEKDPKMTGKKPRILCLDDQPDNLGLRKIFLELFGCEVAAVTDADSCLEAADEENFDLAILDYHLMEESTGEDVANELRRRFPEMRLVMLTGDPNVPPSVDSCVDALIIKGTSNPSELLDTIEQLLPDCYVKPRRKHISREDLPYPTNGRAQEGS